MALPVAKAASLAKDMASKGIPGMIKMGEPMKVSKSEDKPMDEPMDEPKSDMMSLAGDMLKAMKSDDEAGLAKLLEELCERASVHSEPGDGDEGSEY